MCEKVELCVDRAIVMDCVMDFVFSYDNPYEDIYFTTTYCILSCNHPKCLCYIMGNNTLRHVSTLMERETHNHLLRLKHKCSLVVHCINKIAALAHKSGEH